MPITFVNTSLLSPRAIYDKIFPTSTSRYNILNALSLPFSPHHPPQSFSLLSTFPWSTRRILIFSGVLIIILLLRLRAHHQSYNLHGSGVGSLLLPSPFIFHSKAPLHLNTISASILEPSPIPNRFLCSHCSIIIPAILPSFFISSSSSSSSVLRLSFFLSFFLSFSLSLSLSLSIDWFT